MSESSTIQRRITELIWKEMDATSPCFILVSSWKFTWKNWIKTWKPWSGQPVSGPHARTHTHTHSHSLTHTLTHVCTRKHASTKTHANVLTLHKKLWKASSNVTFSFEGEIKLSLGLDDELVSEWKVGQFKDPEGKVGETSEVWKVGKTYE